MSGERDLDTLLASMRPRLAAGEFVFCTVGEETARRIEALGTFREAEGITLIVSREVADAHALRYESVWRQITLEVHSSLEAVGFLAAIAKRLAEHRISCNAVSAFYHDHLFVPAAAAETALELLQNP